MNAAKPRKVILDVDTGSDDAIAIMAALKSEDLEVVGICTVWGNLPVAETAHNTLAVCEALGVNVPVYQGAHHSMAKELTPGRTQGNNVQPIIRDGVELRIHFPRLTGLPDTDRVPESSHALEYYYNYLTAAVEPVTLIATGPLTNLGFLFRLAPELSAKVKELIIMGGGVEVTNAAACGEANVWHDPEAMEIILRAGLEPTLVTLDATHSAPLSLEDCQVLENLGTFEGRFTANIIRQRIAYETARFENRGAWSPIHDALAVCAAIEPEVLTVKERARIRAEVTGKSDGEILIDRRAKAEEPNATLAVKADKDKFLNLLLKLFGPPALEEFWKEEAGMGQ